VYELCKSPLDTPLLPTPSTSSVASQTTPVPGHAIFPDGNIIVSADYTGQIKVFRQDSAWSFRKPEMSDTASIRLRAMSSLGRGSSNSIRPSGFLPRRNSQVTTSRAPSIHSAASIRESVDGSTAPTNSSQQNLAVPSPTATSKPNGRNASPSPTRKGLSLFDRGRAAAHQQDPTRLTTPSPSSNRKPQTAQDRLMLQEDNQSMAYYNLNTHRVSSAATERSNSLSPVRRRGSLSSDASDSDEATSFVDAPERFSTDDMVCKNCGGRTFNAFKVQSGRHKGETKLRCSV
jgi:WD repeat-containing protein 44